MSDPWAEFSDAPQADPWGEFKDAPAQNTRANVPTVANVQRNLSRRAVDGDTAHLDGKSVRLSGADAFELRQPGYANGPYPLGRQSQTFLQSRLGPRTKATDTGARSFDRPVVLLNNGSEDLGRSSIGAGMSVPVPKYLQPPRLDAYVKTQRKAIAAERGAYGGQYQLPSEYRKQGDAAPMRGKIAMTKAQTQQWSAMLRDPKTTEADLNRWMEAQGHKATNLGNILQFMRRNPKATPSAYFQQADVLDEPVLRDEQWLPTRLLAAFNEGLPDFAGAPVDLVNAGMGAVGLPVSGNPVMGSEWLRAGMNSLGIGQTTEGYAPRSDVERYGQSIARGLGQSAIPAGGMIAGGGRLLRSASPMALSALPIAAANPIRAAARTLLTEAAKRPGLTLAAEAGAGIGAGVGGQAARDQFPNSPLADALGQTIGGIAGGIGAGAPFMRARPRSTEPVGAADEWAEFADAVPGVAAMENDVTPASISARVPDRIDVWAEFQDAGAINDPALGRVRPLMDQATPAQMAATANRVTPEGMVPIPRNEVESLDEAMRANPGPRQLVQAPDERKVLPSHKPAPNLPARRDPLDLVSWLRTQGGISEAPKGLSASGIRPVDLGRKELAHSGIDNTPRNIEFAKSEGFLGKLINDESGMTLDDAAQAAWERGYFPDMSERPTVAEFLDAVRETHKGGSGRVFHPDDFEAIDAYRAAQAQRGRVETAAQEGAPLVEDVGHPVSLDDLDANQPPATAYEDLPRVGGKAGNIVLDKLESKEDIQRALMNTDAVVGGFDAARRGKVSHAETEALARELNMTADDLLRRRKGQALNAEQALAARSILAKSGDELVAMANKAVGGSDEDLASFRRAWLRHVAIQEQVSGATAEAGRALSQFRMAASSRLPRGRVLKELLGGADGRNDLEKAAEAILDLQRVTNDPAKVNAYAMKAANPAFKDKLIELWYNSLLSGPQTHAVNILSNSMTAALQLPEHAAASMVGAARRAFSTGEIDRVMGSELGARMTGLLQGTREGLRAFARTARTGQVLDPMTKVEAAEREAISGLKGKVIRIPTRMLSAEDELFKAIGRRMELNGLAVREASKEGLKGEAFRKRVAELSANPTDEMLERSFDYARYVTFQRPLGKIGQSMMNITAEWPLLKLFLPFIRTPSNIFKYVIERSPAAPVVKDWRTDFAAGGARRDLALAKMALGTGLGMLITDLAAQGHVTGSGPADEGAKQLLRADGWAPYSIRIGDKYYSYQRLDPIASTLGVAADLAATSEYMTEKQREKSAALVTTAIMKNLSNKTWLSGISSMVEAMSEPDRFAPALIARLSGSIAIPTGVAQIARTTDPILREAQEPIDAIKARIPIVSKSLPARTDVWGRPIVNEGGLGPNIVSPIWVNTRRNDPVNKALLDLGVNVGRPSRPRVDGKSVDDDQFREYRNLSGQLTHGALLPYVTSPDWPSLSPEDQEDLVARLKRDARKEAKAGMFGAGR